MSQKNFPGPDRRDGPFYTFLNVGLRNILLPIRTFWFENYMRKSIGPPSLQRRDDLFPRRGFGSNSWIISMTIFKKIILR